MEKTNTPWSLNHDCPRWLSSRVSPSPTSRVQILYKSRKYVYVQTYGRRRARARQIGKWSSPTKQTVVLIPSITSPPALPSPLAIPLTRDRVYFKRNYSSRDNQDTAYDGRSVSGSSRRTKDARRRHRIAARFAEPSPARYHLNEALLITTYLGYWQRLCTRRRGKRVYACKACAIYLLQLQGHERYARLKVSAASARSGEFRGICNLNFRNTIRMLCPHLLSIGYTTWEREREPYILFLFYWRISRRKILLTLLQRVSRNDARRRDCDSHKICEYSPINFPKWYFEARPLDRVTALLLRFIAEENI